MKAAAFLASALFGAALSAQSVSSDNAALERMRELDKVSKWAHDGNAEPPKNAPPVLKGPDDDPTLAADTSTHEPAPTARKLASRAERLAKQGKHDEAIAEFEKALSADPEYYEAANNLAIEYFEAGQSDRALDTLRKLTERDSKHVLAFDNLAILLCRLQRYKEAEAVATKAYSMHPFSYKAAYVFGAALVNQGKWTPDAKQSLRYASARHPEAKELLARWPASAGGTAQ